MIRPGRSATAGSAEEESSVPTGLAGLRVVDFSTQIAGPYCTKVLADAGAEVVTVEPPEGDPRRRWSATGPVPAGQDAALFTYLNIAKHSVQGSSSDPHVADRVRTADAVVHAFGLENDAGEHLDVERLRADHPDLVVLSITPYGTAGPWSDRRATEFTLQAECGSIGIRGVPGRQPYQAGGRIAEWSAGAYGAFALLAAVAGARRGGGGAHVDLSILEVANLVFTNFSEPMNRLLNGGPDDPDHVFLAPSIETPSIEPTVDGYVGFCTNARQQFNDFLVLIDRADLLEDAELGTVAGRMMRLPEWTAIVHGWCEARTTADVIEQASLLRIPVSYVCNGESLPRHEQIVDRGVYRRGTGDGVVRPRRPYLIDGVAPDVTAPPATAEKAMRPPARESGPDVSPTSPGRDAHPPFSGGTMLPFAGLKIVDFTAWWAGPAATHLLATFGADVIHVESPHRPDGMRMIGGPMAAHYPEWWEASPHFLYSNTNKRGLTLDLGQPKGVELFARLVGWCDAVVENFTPRVLENFGVDWEWVQRVNPDAVLMRMPAYGLTGPWRDRPGFAQNIEQLSGLAWVTGHPDDQPRVPRGPCDPVAGVHAAIALLVALADRQRDGRGHHVEVPLCEVALNIAAEQVVEHSAYGRRMERDGNRSSTAAPQGLYPTADHGSPTAGWIALTVADDGQWRALRALMGEPAWAQAPGLDRLAGRRQAHDEIDEHLARWTGRRHRSDLVATLRSAGITASDVADPARLIQTNPQFGSRAFFERPDHPVVGAMPLPSMPFRIDGVERWIRSPAPTVGQHNEEVLAGLLGLSADELRHLEEDRVIGTGLTGHGSS